MHCLGSKKGHQNAIEFQSSYMRSFKKSQKATSKTVWLRRKFSPCCYNLMQIVHSLMSMVCWSTMIEFILEWGKTSGQSWFKTCMVLKREAAQVFTTAFMGPMNIFTYQRWIKISRWMCYNVNCANGVKGSMYLTLVCYNINLKHCTHGAI